MLNLLREDFDGIWEEELLWSELDNKTILVTGASGLIGSFLIYALLDRNIRYKSNIHILALARDKKRLRNKYKQYGWVDIMAQDIANPIKYKNPIDYIVHTACDVQPKTASGNPVGICKTILEGMLSVCDFACEKKAKVINLSSINVFGEAQHQEPFTDDMPVRIPLNDSTFVYHEGKRMSEMICASYSAQQDMDYSVLRPGRVYGPTMNTDDSMVLSEFLLNAATGHDLTLKSSGNQRYTYVYVADVISAIFYLMLLGRRKNYNCGEGTEIERRNLGEIVQLICNENHVCLSRSELNEEEKAIYSSVKYSVMTSERLMRLGWKKKTDIVCGIEKTSRILRKLYGE